jgi:hypothetical protein
MYLLDYVCCQDWVGKKGTKINDVNQDTICFRVLKIYFLKN